VVIKVQAIRINGKVITILPDFDKALRLYISRVGWDWYRQRRHQRLIVLANTLRQPSELEALLCTEKAILRHIPNVSS
jgi:hypothetical protein